MAEPLDESGEWLTLSAAASRLGWHLQRVQSRARREAWPKRKANRGAALEYLVPAGAWDESPNDPPDESDSVPAEPDAVAGELREAVERWRTAAEAARAEAAGVRGELAAEQRRNAELAGELRAALAKAETRADRLEAALAEARRGWLERMVKAWRRKGT